MDWQHIVVAGAQVLKCLHCCCAWAMQGIGVVVASEKPTMSSTTPNGSLAAGGSCSAAAATAHVEPLRKDQPAGR
jgi:hypothetical protein